ncbi:angiopoietin-related protein 1-like [Apostichopus japonicus]|uniref:angiopoietin-related protein 1-like n=1 Tax=Stichopus japonicus TaxID=307972 RepID=UPI003AB59739
MIVMLLVIYTVPLTKAYGHGLRGTFQCTNTPTFYTTVLSAYESGLRGTFQCTNTPNLYTTALSGYHTDCKDVYDAGHTQDGIYTILPSGWPGSPFTVYCKMDNGGRWTVFQRHSGTTSFYQNWDAYKKGFGDLNDDFWLGNEKLFFLTNQTGYTLRFDVITSGGEQKYAEYTEFQIESESNKYRLDKLGTHAGTTGWRIYNNLGKAFSTYDRDNDDCNAFNCANRHRSGWWHSDHWCATCDNNNGYCDQFHVSGSCHSVCTSDNLNGDYNGVGGENVFSNHNAYCSLNFTEMKIRPS